MLRTVRMLGRQMLRMVGILRMWRTLIMLLVIPILGRLGVERTRMVIIPGVNIAWKKI